jgi:MoaA/NifB/PqqE/SkfB family radical SAM enzyme
MAKPNKDTHCPAPWHLIRVRNVGAFGPCCHYQSDMSEAQSHNMQSMTVSDYRSGVRMTQLRQDMLNGLRPKRCSHCFQEESTKKISLRQKLNNQYTDWNKDYSADQPGPLKEIQIELGNLCNYKCVTCFPEFSTQVGNDWKKLNWLDSKDRPKYLASDFTNDQSSLHIGLYFDQKYIDSFNANISDLDSVRILGGEPLINPMIDQYIDLFDPEHAGRVQLLIATNCSVWRPDLLTKFRKFGRVKLSLSIDATGDLYDYIRHKGRWSEVEKNLRLFQDGMDEFGYIPTVTVTVSVYNLVNLVDIIEQLTYLLPRIKIVLNPVYDPSVLDISIMPDQLKSCYIDRVKTAKINPLYQHKIWLQIEMFSFARRLKETSYDSVRWNQFVEYTQSLESIRNNSITDLVPEIKPWFNLD